MNANRLSVAARVLRLLTGIAMLLLTAAALPAPILLADNEMLSVHVPSAMLSSPAGHFGELAVDGASPGTVVPSGGGTLDLGPGIYTLRTHHGYPYGTFTISKTQQGLAITATTGALVSAPAGVSFELTKLLAVHRVDSPLSSPPGLVTTHIQGVEQFNLNPADKTTLYLPAGKYEMTTWHLHQYGTFTISGAFGSLAITEMTGALTASTTSSGVTIGFDLTKLLPVRPIQSVLSEPAGLIQTSVAGVEAFHNVGVDSVTLYLPPGTFEIQSLGGASFGKFTVSGNFGALSITATTGAIVKTATGISFDTCALNPIRIAPISGDWGLSGTSAGVNAPATLFVPDGTYRVMSPVGETDAVFTVFSGQLLFVVSPSQASVTLGACHVPVDIKPGDSQNTINLGAQGELRVAILSTLTFNAPRDVDPSTIRLAGSPVQSKGNEAKGNEAKGNEAKGNEAKAVVEDVNGDSVPDLVVHVSVSALQLTKTSTEAVLTAKTMRGQNIIGRDAVHIVPGH